MKKLESSLISIVPDIGKVESRLIDSIDVSSYQEDEATIDEPEIISKDSV
jgi:hypothetical protein